MSGTAEALFLPGDPTCFDPDEKLWSAEWGSGLDPIQAETHGALLVAVLEVAGLREIVAP